MAARTPLTLAEKERLYTEKLRGRSLATIATELGCSPQTARKWWRVARDQGRSAFRRVRRGRAPTGVLSRFPPAVTQRALALKQAHPAWGPDRVLTDLQLDPTLTGLPLPHRSQLALLFLRRGGPRMGVEVPFVPFLALGFLLAYFIQWNPLAAWLCLIDCVVY